MSKKNHQSDSNQGQQAGEISIIRDILMGRQISEYETRFNQLDERLNQLEEIFHQRIDHLNVTISEREEQSTRDFSDRMDRLENLIASSIEDLNSKIDKVTNEDKKKLGKMMAELSQKLIGE